MKKIKIAHMMHPVFNPYEQATYEIYVSGCNKNCDNCHNPELQRYESGIDVSMGKIINHMKNVDKFFDIISITGGDLLYYNNNVAKKFVDDIKIAFSDKAFWLFTGEKMENIPSWAYKRFNVIKTGKYIKELDDGNNFPASKNQKVLITRKRKK